jgi:Flp pilus assembly pilin Flp
MINTIRQTVESADGQSLAEYALLMSLIAVVCLVSLTALGLAISGTTGSITGAV